MPNHNLHRSQASAQEPLPLLNDPSVVERHYAAETDFQRRRRVYAFGDREDPASVAGGIIRALAPVDVLEAGAGLGTFAAGLHSAGMRVIATDTSPRMVELAASAGVPALVADVQDLPFENSSFDCCIALWVLQHPSNLDRAIGELRRVLRPDGTLVAATNSDYNFVELWRALAPEVPIRVQQFSAENGSAALLRHFSRVEIKHVTGSVSFPSAKAAEEYISASVTRARYASRASRLAYPFVASTRAAVFTASK